MRNSKGIKITGVSDHEKSELVSFDALFLLPELTQLLSYAETLEEGICSWLATKNYLEAGKAKGQALRAALFAFSRRKKQSDLVGFLEKQQYQHDGKSYGLFSCRNGFSFKSTTQELAEKVTLKN